MSHPSLAEGCLLVCELPGISGLSSYRPSLLLWPQRPSGKSGDLSAYMGPVRAKGFWWRMNSLSSSPLLLSHRSIHASVLSLSLKVAGHSFQGEKTAQQAHEWDKPPSLLLQLVWRLEFWSPSPGSSAPSLHSEFLRPSASPSAGLGCGPGGINYTPIPEGSEPPVSMSLSEYDCYYCPSTV